MNDKILTNPKEYFWFRDGKGARSIRELLEHIPLISDDEFFTYVNEDKNDFASWLEGVFDEKSLADQLRVTEDRKDFELTLYNVLMSEEVDRKKRVQEIFNKEQRKVFSKDTDRFNRIKARESKKQEKEGERFDEAARQLDEKAHSVIPITISRHDAFEQRLNELKDYIQGVHKEGKDTFLADQLLKRYEFKLKYADITGTDEDYDAVEKLLTEAEQELQDSYMAESVDVRKEIDVLLSILHSDKGKVRSGADVIADAEARKKERLGVKEPLTEEVKRSEETNIVEGNVKKDVQSESVTSSREVVEQKS